MDDGISYATSPLGDPTRGGPALVAANWYRFTRGEEIAHAVVAAMTVLWVVTGRGRVTSYGTDHLLEPGAVLVLPWRHDVAYAADAKVPFHIGTVHVVPWHADAEAVVPRVAFRPGDDLYGSPARRGDGGPATPLLNSSKTASGQHVSALGSYAIDLFRAGRIPEAGLRALGLLIHAEVQQWSTPDAEATTYPPILMTMREFVLDRLDMRLAVADIAEAGGVSPATAERLFARHTGHSVLAWVRQQRMEAAAALLRTTSLRVNEVARQVGYEDPLHFSRAFRKAYDVPPSRYADGQLRP